jgi:hypothetical protein
LRCFLPCCFLAQAATARRCGGEGGVRCGRPSAGRPAACGCECPHLRGGMQRRPQAAARRAELLRRRHHHSCVLVRLRSQGAGESPRNGRAFAPQGRDRRSRPRRRRG